MVDVSLSSSSYASAHYGGTEATVRPKVSGETLVARPVQSTPKADVGKNVKGPSKDQSQAGAGARVQAKLTKMGLPVTEVYVGSVKAAQIPSEGAEIYAEQHARMDQDSRSERVV